MDIFEVFLMPKTIGYMLTWTTYGTWLQGDKRGYVKGGKILQGNEELLELCKQFQKETSFKLKNSEKEIVRRAIINEAKRTGIIVEALVVCSNHVHLVVRYFSEPVGQTVSRFKNVTSSALRNGGKSGRIWTRGFDRRFCYNDEDLNNRIQYVQNHR